MLKKLFMFGAALLLGMNLSFAGDCTDGTLAELKDDLAVFADTFNAPILISDSELNKAVYNAIEKELGKAPFPLQEVQTSAIVKRLDGGGVLLFWYDSSGCFIEAATIDTLTFSRVMKEIQSI